MFVFAVCSDVRLACPCLLHQVPAACQVLRRPAPCTARQSLFIHSRMPRAHLVIEAHLSRISTRSPHPTLFGVTQMHSVFNDGISLGGLHPSQSQRFTVGIWCGRACVCVCVWWRWRWRRRAAGSNGRTHAAYFVPLLSNFTLLPLDVVHATQPHNPKQKCDPTYVFCSALFYSVLFCSVLGPFRHETAANPNSSIPNQGMGYQWAGCNYADWI